MRAMLCRSTWATAPDPGAAGRGRWGPAGWQRAARPEWAALSRALDGRRAAEVHGCAGSLVPNQMRLTP